MIIYQVLNAWNFFYVTNRARLVAPKFPRIIAIIHSIDAFVNGTDELLVDFILD